MKEELKALEKKMASKYKMLKTERGVLAGILSRGQQVWVYPGGKNLNALDHPPAYAKTKFIIRPKLKP